MNIYDFVDITSNDFDRPVDEFIKIAKRHNNTKREFLFVNTLLGKHIATPAKNAIEMAYKLELCLCNTIVGNDWQDKKILLVGFAETATALAQNIFLKSTNHRSLNIVGYAQTTRENIVSNNYINIAFEEEHSHATTQKLYFDKDLEYDIIVFVDDEITTGKTILNFIDQFEKYQPNKKYIVASILNWQNNRDRKLFNDRNITAISLVKGEIKDTLPKLNITKDSECDLYVNDEYYNIALPPESNLRTPIKLNDIRYTYIPSICDGILKLQYINNTPKETLVIGTEENMFIPMWIANYLQADVKATTRSPIEPSLDTDYPIISRFGIKYHTSLNLDDTDYPISSRLKLNSAYNSERITYLYNIYKDITTYDRFIIVVEEKSPVFEKKLKDFLDQYVEVIIINQKELLKNEE